MTTASPAPRQYSDAPVLAGGGEEVDIPGDMVGPPEQQPCADHQRVRRKKSLQNPGSSRRVRREGHLDANTGVIGPAAVKDASPVRLRPSRRSSCELLYQSGARLVKLCTEPLDRIRLARGRRGGVRACGGGWKR